MNDNPTDAREQCELGLYYLYRIKAADASGNPVLETLLSENMEKAAYWFTQSAEQGYVTGQVNIANLYENGAGVPENKEKAIYWYTKAAEQGSTEAQERLKNLSSDSNGCGCYIVLIVVIIIIIAIIAK